MENYRRPKNFIKRPLTKPTARRRPSVKKAPTPSPKKASVSGIQSALLNKLRKPRAPKEKPKYFQLPRGVKLKILSRKDKTRLRITESPDTIGPQLKKRGEFPNQKQMDNIRRYHEFWDPNNSGVPLVEVAKSDLDKVVLICGTKKNPVKYKLKEFLRIDPKDIDDAPQGTYFTINGEYYRKITRLSPLIIQKFGRLHKELEKAVNRHLTKSQRRISVRLFIDENYRTYGENIYTCFKKPPEKRYSLPSYFSIHTSGKALDIQTFILVNGIRIEGPKAEYLLRKAITAEWNKHEGGRGFYPKYRNFHIDARNKKAQWGREWE